MGNISVLTIPLFLNLFLLSSAVIVEIEDGKLNGTVMITRKFVSFDAFLKIPFAEPPIGRLRFQPPVPNKKWEGILNATEYGPMCIQRKTHFNISEDCLHLNVFTKNIGSTNLLPVIVYIHGGSFEEGSARNHQPFYLMDRELVVVTINYRHGLFGFLSTGTEDAYGNMGLKDQTLALKWIQKNIDKFGGDPTRVTITGLSAGAYSVTAHMASEMSQNLFRRVIAVSGSITTFGKLYDNHLNLVVYLAEKSNCTTSNITEMVRCLQNKSALSLLAIDASSATNCKYAVTWLPVIEKDFGQERFLSQHPSEIFNNPKTATKAEIMIGMTEHEMFYLVPTILADTKFFKRMNENPNQLASECFYLEKYSDSTVFRNVYLPFDDIDHRSFNGLGNLFGDGSIGYGVHKLVKMISKYTDVYYYKFSYTGRFSVFNYPGKFPYGVSHADDLQYVFNSWYIGPDIALYDPESFMVERMTRLWEQFAANGDPNKPSDPYLADMKWPKHDDQEYYLDIGYHMVEKQGLNLERFNAFDDLINYSPKMKGLNYFLSFFTIIFITKLT